MASEISSKARASVGGHHGQLRALTPLHDAGNLDVALALLEAMANPWPNDPREPDPAWYHEQRRRNAVAQLIRRRRNALVATNREASEAQKVCLPLSSSEWQVVKRSFETMGSKVLELFINEAECVICMVDIKPEDKLLNLPCVKPGVRPHAFHSSCLERWLLTKAGCCPICRYSLRRSQSAPSRRPQSLVSLRPLPSIDGRALLP